MGENEGAGLTLRAASTWTTSGMKRKTTPLALLLSRGDVANEYTASMDTLSTLLCFASLGFCSRICAHQQDVAQV